MADIKPFYCPFCKSTKTTFWTILGSLRHHQIKCDKCGAMGPLVENEHKKTAYKLALEAWNKRTVKP